MNIHEMRRGMRHPRKALNYVATRLRGEWYRFLNRRKGNMFQCGRNFRVADVLDIHGPGTVIIGDDVLFEGGPFKINTLYTYTPEAVIRIGSHSYLNGIRIGCRSAVTLGEYCICADARITDNDAHSVYPYRWDPKAPVDTRPVSVEDNVWICLAAIVLKGVTIGRNSVIAAGAVVSRSIPPNSVAGGNPATVIKTFLPEEIERGESFLRRPED